MDGDPISVAVSIRDAEESDRRFLEHMFIEAVLWDPAVKRQSLDRLLLVPELRRYVIDWGRPGDLALIATVAQASVGAAWYRLVKSEEPGYGFVDESVPELGIAVLAEWRGRCIGTTLLEALLRLTRAAAQR